MKVKTTLTLTKLLNKELKKDKKFENYNLTLEKLTESQFSWWVDLDSFKHEIDFNFETNKFNVIKIEYPQNFYACNKYITTKELMIIFKTCDKTLNGFINEFKNYIEI